MREAKIKIHEIATDGLPPRDSDGNLPDHLVGCIAFIWNGAIVSGWPINGTDLWESDEDAMGVRPFSGVTHWVEFPVAVWDLCK